MQRTFRVLLFAQLREELGWNEKSFPYEPGLTVGEIRDRILKSVLLEPLAEGLFLARNQEYTGSEEIICPGDEIALIPPVSGG